jgi:hypothetical protein
MEMSACVEAQVWIGRVRRESCRYPILSLSKSLFIGSENDKISSFHWVGMTFNCRVRTSTKKSAQNPATVTLPGPGAVELNGDSTPSR